VRELCLQDPSFGFYLLKLTSNRLLQNIRNLEQLVQTRSEPAPA
jgi:CRP-like cAMP-binding protein